MPIFARAHLPAAGGAVEHRDGAQQLRGLQAESDAYCRLVCNQEYRRHVPLAIYSQLVRIFSNQTLLVVDKLKELDVIAEAC